MSDLVVLQEEQSRVEDQQLLQERDEVVFDDVVAVGRLNHAEKTLVIIKRLDFLYPKLYKWFEFDS